MADYTVKQGLCITCKTLQTAKLHLKISVSGAESFVWVCLTCRRFNPFGGNLFIPSETVVKHLTQDQIAALPVMMPDAYSRCVVCGERKAELHHWAPRAIFGDDCEKWPKDFLCKQCHDEWHKKMTP